MIKKITCLILTTFLVLALSISSTAYYGESLPRVIDDADLLMGTEEMQLLAKFDNIADTAEFDVIIATVNTLDGKSPQEYADDLYDYNDFGLGDKKDGILLLVSMEDRDVYISTTGLGIEIFGDGVWDDSILNRITPYLSDGRYYDAFRLYASLCEMHIIPEESEGIPDDFNNDGNFDEYYYDNDFNENYYYDSDNGYYVPHSTGFDFDAIAMIPVAIIIGMIISLLIMIGFRSKLKSVRRKPTAHDYQIPDSMQITHQSDMYLYSHVSRTPKQTQNNNHSRGGGGFSGGGVHIGSSGRSHGGGGGKF